MQEKTHSEISIAIHLIHARIDDSVPLHARAKEANEWDKQG